jgi:hypothetical protein
VANEFSDNVSILIDIRTTPLAVLVESCIARLFEAAVELEWSVYSDEGIRGYRVYREEEGLHDRALMNHDVIPAGEHAYIDRNALPGKTYLYTLGAVTLSGSEIRSSTISVTVRALPVSLQQNHPNPFNPNTIIPFYLPVRAYVEIGIYSVDGKLVRSLVDAWVPEGHWEVAWNGLDGTGNRAASGVYFYRLRAGKHAQAKKMILLR